MKNFASLLLFLCIFLSSSVLNASSPANTMVGMWKMTKSYDMKTRKVFIPKKDVFYQFNSDGSMIMVDTNFKERKVWSWNLKKGILKMNMLDGSWKIKSPVRFKSSTRFIIMVNFGKSIAGKDQKYLWSFSKI